MYNRLLLAVIAGILSLGFFLVPAGAAFNAERCSKGQSQQGCK